MEKGGKREKPEPRACQGSSPPTDGTALRVPPSSGAIDMKLEHTDDKSLDETSENLQGPGTHTGVLRNNTFDGLTRML